MKSDKLLIEGCVDKIKEITEVSDKSLSYSFGDGFDSDGECTTVGDLIGFLNKFDKSYTVKFCDPDGAPTDWKIYSIWNSEWEKANDEPEPSNKSVWIRVAND